jgi:hypothetical protein
VGVYVLSNYLFVCEKHPFFGFGGCGAELLVEQARGIKDAAEQAAGQGWRASPPGHWDDNREWSAWCSYCANAWDAKRAAAKAKQLVGVAPTEEKK